MGCHTWFFRPVTQEEFELFKSNAIAEAWYILGDTEENRVADCVDMALYNEIKESVENNTNLWWEGGYGTTIIDEDGNEKNEYTEVIDGKMYLDLAERVNPIFPDLKRYHDVFRVDDYPEDIIHSLSELQTWLIDNYDYKLEDWQIERVQDFFDTYKDGVITFG